MKIFSTYLASSTLGLWDAIRNWYDGSILCELIDYLVNRYFTVEMGSYENFSLSASAGGTIRSIIVGLTFGIILASFMTAYTRSHLGKFIRAAVKAESLSPDRALTLGELGFFRSSSIRRELSRGVTLRKYIGCIEEEQKLLELEELSEKEKKTAQSKPYRYDFIHDHFYLKEENRYLAEVQFDASGSGWKMAFGTIVIAILFCSLVCWAMPDLFKLADNLISFLAP